MYLVNRENWQKLTLHRTSLQQSSFKKTMKVQTEQKDFNPQQFVDVLLTEGVHIPCDESEESFNRVGALPTFYDEFLFKRGQKFYHDHIFALFFCKFLGLLTLLAISSVRKILIWTKMSGSVMTAYRRYMSTVFHMNIWYQSDFTPNSKLWQSLSEVRHKHNSVSKKCYTAGLNRISQKDMALTQFGFMGYAVARREQVGVHNASDEELRAFIHVWRVIGWLLGVQDRFNICRDSVEETTAICRIIAEQVFIPAVELKDKEFISMASYLTEGMWAFNPMLQTNIFLNLMYRFLKVQVNNNNNTEYYVTLNFAERMMLSFLIWTIWCLQFKIVRFYHNTVQIMSLGIMRVFPFLAYYSFGYENSHIEILNNKSKLK